MDELRDHIEKFSSPSKFEMAVVGPDIPDPIYNMVEKTFNGTNVKVYGASIEGVRDKLVLFEDMEVIATSALQEVADALLLVNSYAYTTGNIGLDELKVPDVIRELEGKRFILNGYPNSNYGKLMLILISRHIERLSYSHKESVHRAGFQQLSRLEDEQGTHRVYQKLSENGAEVHTYGLPDWTPPEEWGLNVHEDEGRDLIRYWFVIHRSPEKDMALLAVNNVDDLWDAIWTTDPEQVQEIEEHLINKYKD